MKWLETILRLLLEEGWWLLPLLVLALSVGLKAFGIRLRLLHGPLFWALLFLLVLPIALLLYFLGHQEIGQAGHYEPPVYHPGGAITHGTIGR